MESIKNQIDQFLDHLTYQKRYSKHTTAAYESDLLDFSKFLEVSFESKTPNEINRRQITSYIAELSESGFNPNSINRKLSTIQSFLEYLLKEGQISKNAARNIKRPKGHTLLPSFVRNEGIEKLFQDIEFPATFEGCRDRLMITIFYACGLRRDELINLKEHHIDFLDFSIKVVGKRNKERIIPVAEILLDQIREYIEIKHKSISEPNEYLLVTKKGKKMYPTLVYRTVKNYLSLVTSMDKKSPHVLRHTFASHLLNEGANLQSIKELLGHSSLAATQVYTHITLDKLKEVYLKSHPRKKNN